MSSNLEPQPEQHGRQLIGLRLADCMKDIVDGRVSVGEIKTLFSPHNCATKREWEIFRWEYELSNAHILIREHIPNESLQDTAMRQKKHDADFKDLKSKIVQPYSVAVTYSPPAMVDPRNFSPYAWIDVKAMQGFSYKADNASLTHTVDETPPLGGPEPVEKDYVADLLKIQQIVQHSQTPGHRYNPFKRNGSDATRAAETGRQLNVLQDWNRKLVQTV